MEENKNIVSYGRLEKEIKIEEESRKLNKNNVENFKNSQKRKKKLRNKILAWILGGAIFAGAAAGGAYLIADNTFGDSAYKKEVQSRYEQVDDKLTQRLIEHTPYEYCHNQEITHIRFLDPSDSSAELQVYYNADFETSFGLHPQKCYAIFNVLIDYYNALVEAEESGNALYYLDALNEIFKHMEFEEYQDNLEIVCDLKVDTEENRIKFNEIFNLNDVQNEDVVRQIGFLPYHVEIVYYNYDEETNRHDYTYKIRGVSYCETVSENSDEVKNHKDLIIENNYNKNHIKTFQRDILFTSSLVNAGFIRDLRLQGDILKIIDGVNNPYTVETTLFQEVNILKTYEVMKEGEFNFKKPDGFNLKAYLNSQETENVK